MNNNCWLSPHGYRNISMQQKMQRSISAFRLSLAVILFGMVLFVRPAAAAPTNHVIIVVMDGARYSETWGDPSHTNIPQIAALASQGIVLTNFYTDITSFGGKTETNPGHATLACGAYQDLANNGSQLPGLPTLFQYYRKQLAAPSNSVWVVASKDKLVILANSAAVGWNNMYQPSFNCGVDGVGGGGYREDYLTHALARTALTNDRPALMLINYRGPDSMGHANNWSGYLTAIREVDGYVVDLWETVQSDPIMKGSTTMFITTDHGRHTDNFTRHGDGCDGCRHLFCVVVGPGMKTKEISGIRATQPDIAVTTADLLGVTMPTATGRVLKELYRATPTDAPSVTTSP